ncbi:GNAT family N-acetyltransferase [Vibrio sp. S4M6]|uniref:GNAT family N-acetyltransferase n=1 Tax=Vibrio sinus TaxID=2946865 RepID=UPI00202AAAEE|nr:GNAT family protein [Vibrio sinus]MCL9781588.1 GNAT family N-acetyltransferase [Vibrio sinus]
MSYEIKNEEQNTLSQEHLSNIAVGERISLYKPSMRLCQNVHQAILESQNEMSKYLPWVQHTLTLERVNDTMLEAIDNFDNMTHELRMPIIDNHTGRFLGMTGLIIRDKSVPCYEIGYWLRTAEVGKGYISEAVKLVESYAFNQLNALRIAITAASTNQKSIAVAKRNGYRHEATLEQNRRMADGQLVDTVVYRKLAHEYQAEQEK